MLYLIFVLAIKNGKLLRWYAKSKLNNQKLKPRFYYTTNNNFI